MTFEIKGFLTLCGLGCLLGLGLVLVPAGCSQDSQNIQPVRLAAGAEATLTWDPVAGARAYNLYFSGSPGVTRANGTRIANAANPITIRDLKRGTTYYFVVTAVDDRGQESAESAEVSFKVE
jgi:hypothetical protein